MSCLIGMKMVCTIVILVGGSVGVMVEYCVGDLVRSEFSKCGLLRTWSVGQLVSWSFGHLVSWSFGQLVIW